MKTRAISLMGLFLELERWALKQLEKVPASAPIALQITESILAVRRDVFETMKAVSVIDPKTGKSPSMSWTRRDEIAAFIACVGGRFLSSAQPFARLVRKGLINVQMDGSMTAAEDRPVTCPTCGRPSAGSPSTNLCGICLLNRK